MRFRTQLAVGVGALLALTLSSGVFGVVTLVVTTGRTSETTGHIVDELSRVHAVRVHAEQVVSSARGYLLTGAETFRHKLEAREREFEQALATLRDHGHRSQLQTQLSTVEHRFIEYTRATADAARQRQVQSNLGALEEAFEREVQPRRRALDDDVEALVTLERARVTAEASESGRLVRRFGIALLIAWVVGFGISIALAVLVVRRLDAQYRRIKDAEQRATEAAQSRKQIVDIVAHDLLSPLNAIVLGLEVMKLKAIEVPEAGPIARAAERMQRLVNDLLDVSRTERLGFALERETHSAAELLDTTCALFADAAARDGVRICSEVDTPELQAFVDRDRVIQVLSNLVGNALKVARPNDEIVLRAERQDSNVRFSVTDAGPGIPSDELGQLFDAYRQGSARQPRGTLGLGLFICKTLVEAHGGVIGVDSAPGKGSTFWFDIPAESARERSPAGPGAPSQA